MKYFSGLRIFRFNHTPASRQHVDGVLANYVISYVHSGRIYWGTESGRLIKQAPLVFFTWPGERWRYGPVDGHWNNRFISFNGPRTKAWVNGGLFPRCTPQSSPRPVHDPDAFVLAFDDLLERLAVEAPDSPAITHALEGLFLKLHQQPKHPFPQSGSAVRVRAVLQAVAAEPERRWDFVAEARKIGCTPTHFRRLCKRQTGRTPIQSLQKARVDRAAALLRANELSVEQVAWACGFEHLSYFYRLFRLSIGMSPGHYQKGFSEIE
ncbi:MAG: helix-turn-helix domain-containing protein [Puniceicoccaceae bacterium]